MCNTRYTDAAVVGFTAGFAANELNYGGLLGLVRYSSLRRVAVFPALCQT